MTGVPHLFFHDTSVLVNFHRAGLVPVLGALFRDNLRWTATIRVECRRQEVRLPLPGLVAAADDVLGEPLFPQDAEHVAIRQLRTQMASPGDHSQEHLGEAETLTLIRHRGLRAVFVTDDRAAMRWAEGTECVGSWKLIRTARRRDMVSVSQATQLWQSFVDAGGRPPMNISSMSAFEAYLR